MNGPRTGSPHLALLSLALLSPFLAPSLARTCQSHAFSGNRDYASCAELPVLSSYLLWNYDETSNDRQHRLPGHQSHVVQPRRLGPSTPPGRPDGGFASTRRLPNSSGSMWAYTASVDSYQTCLTPGNLNFGVLNISAVLESCDMTIFAARSRANNDGELCVTGWPHGGRIPRNAPDKRRQCKVGGDSGLPVRDRRREWRIGKLKAAEEECAWGVECGELGDTDADGGIDCEAPRCSNRPTTAWFYLHVLCQASAYVVDVVGRATASSLGANPRPTTRSAEHRPHPFCPRNYSVHAWKLHRAWPSQMISQAKLVCAREIDMISHMTIWWLCSAGIRTASEAQEGSQVQVLLEHVSPHGRIHQDRVEHRQRVYGVGHTGSGIEMADRVHWDRRLLGGRRSDSGSRTWYIVIKRKKTASSTQKICHSINGDDGYSNGRV
ncbi:hypothetical protein NL676_014653 [Syzygium grande]|nr:hypothetical protein NL676_014653 [Syzygium grande]